MKKVCQGEIWWIDPTPKMGSEQRGKRPALVIQNDLANLYLKTTIIAVISSSGQIDMPEIVPLKKNTGLKKGSFADFAQIFTIDKNRLTERVGKIPASQWDEVKEALGTIFLKTI